MADFPNGWGGFADAMHVDFKVPSEHLLNGVRYDAELQVFHLHKNRRRMPSTATLIRATADGFNWYFDEVLQAFQFEFHRDALLCASKQRRERKLVQDFYQQVLVGTETSTGTNNTNNRPRTTDYTSWAHYSIESDEPGYYDNVNNNNNNQTSSGRGGGSLRGAASHRELQTGVWDPHHPMVQPSVYFYRYEGSLTEPPCSEWVSWFVTDVPMTIGLEQLEQLKNILFNHIDHNCRRTSVHYQHSVARPIQETMNRPVTLCTSLDFAPDP